MNFFSSFISANKKHEPVQQRLMETVLSTIDCCEFEKAIFEDDVIFNSTHPFVIDNHMTRGYGQRFGYDVFVDNVIVFKVRSIPEHTWKQQVHINKSLIGIKDILEYGAKKLIEDHEKFINDKNKDNMKRIKSKITAYIC